MMTQNDPEALAPNEELEAARELAKMISDFRSEFMDKTRQEIEDELLKIEAEGYDPTRGRGRGPRWADGG